MGTEVLYSQDLLAQRLHIAPPHFHHRRNFSSQANFSNSVVNRRSCSNNNRKTFPQSDKRKSNEAKGARKEGGGVRIMRRGQSLSCISAKLSGGDARSVSPPAADDMTVGRMRPERMPLPLLEVYAGSAFSLSPSPRSLPLPSFSTRISILPMIQPPGICADCFVLIEIDNPPEFLLHPPVDIFHNTGEGVF